MKTTLKVAELASFIYGLLFFVGYCMTMAYNSSFGIDISSYMSTSEILLGFLGHPLLYIPVLLALAFWGIRFGVFPTEKKSYSAKYAEIGTRTDYFLMPYVIWTIAVIWARYRLPFSSIIAYFLVALLFMCLLPGYTNLNMKEYLEQTKKIIQGLTAFIKGLLRKTKKKKGQDQKKNHPAIKPRNPRLIQLRKFYHHNHKETDVIRMRMWVMRIHLSRTEKRFITWAYDNPFLYFSLTIYLFVTVTMVSAQYAIGQEIKYGTIKPLKTIELETEHIRITPDGNGVIYLGETNGYVFLYDNKKQESIVIDRDDIIDFRIKAPLDSYSDTSVRIHGEATDEQETPAIQEEKITTVIDSFGVLTKEYQEASDTL